MGETVILYGLQANNQQELDFMDNASMKVAQAMIAAAREYGYFLEDEPLRSAPELVELEKPLFVNMFKAFKDHLQTVNRMELDADEISNMFNFAVGKGADMAFNFMNNQSQDMHVEGLFSSRVSLYVDDRLMNFLKNEPIAARLGGAYVDFQSVNQGIDPVLGLFEALKWTMRITEHLTLKFIERIQNN